MVTLVIPHILLHTESHSPDFFPKQFLMLYIFIVFEYNRNWFKVKSALDACPSLLSAVTLNIRITQQKPLYIHVD